MGELIVVEHAADIKEFTLGPGNRGNFGPDEETLANMGTFLQKVVDPARRYRGLHDGSWECVDGRGEEDEPRRQGLYGSGRMPGGYANTTTAADLMDHRLNNVTHGGLLLRNTTDGVRSGKKLYVHGDDQAGAGGCKAMAEIREGLIIAAENPGIIVPRVMLAAEAVELTRYGIEPHHVTKAIITGGERAQDKRVWDLGTGVEGARNAVGLSRAAGAHYKLLVGKHLERKAVGVVSPGTTYDSRGFAQDHRDSQGREQQLFAATLRLFVDEVMKDGARLGQTSFESALRAMRGITFAPSISKLIFNEHNGYILL